MGKDGNGPGQFETRQPDMKKAQPLPGNIFEKARYDMTKHVKFSEIKLKHEYHFNPAWQPVHAPVVRCGVVEIEVVGKW